MLGPHISTRARKLVLFMFCLTRDIDERERERERETPPVCLGFYSGVVLLIEQNI